MSTLVLGILLASLSRGSALRADSTQSDEFAHFTRATFTVPGGFTLNYRILMPQDFEQKAKYPLVVVLHGSGERGNDNQSQLRHVARTFLDAEKRIQFPAIVVFPQCPDGQSWHSGRSIAEGVNRKRIFNYRESKTAVLEAAVALVENLVADGSVDPSRVYLMGLSMGGMGVYEAIFHYPALFAAAVPICGGGDHESYDVRVAHMPFWVFHGGADAVVNVSESRSMVERLRTLGAPVRYTEYLGVGHESWVSAMEEPGLFEWLMAQSRTASGSK